LGGSLEQPPNAASVSTGKQKMRALRFIRRALAFETFSSESEGITEHDRSQRVGRPLQLSLVQFDHPFSLPVGDRIPSQLRGDIILEHLQSFPPFRLPRLAWPYNRTILPDRPESTTRQHL
jgi:hypothetical protein